jgi:hypothetical protein
MRKKIGAKTGLSYERGPKGPCLVVFKGNEVIRHFLNKREVYALATTMLGELARIGKVYQ